MSQRVFNERECGCVYSEGTIAVACKKHDDKPTASEGWEVVGYRCLSHGNEKMFYW